MPTTTAVIYCRVSSDRQATEGHGLDGQERRCREYAATHGHPVVKVFRDEGASGGTIERPALQELFAYLRKHREGVLVLFEDVSRIARDMAVHIQILSTLTRLGASYQTVNQPIEDTAVGKFIVQSLANVAEFHRNLNAQNVRNRMRSRLQAGYWTFENPPGYRYETVPGHGRMLVADHPKAEVAREALQGFASGRFQTQAEVRRFLQDHGFRHRGGSGTVHPEQVRRLLTQVLYTGYLECRKWDIPLTKAHHEPLIPLATFDRIQERLAEKAALPHDRKDMSKDFPLRGFVLCSACGKPYTANWSRGRSGRFPYYRCAHRGCPLAAKSVRKEVIEGQFEQLLQSVRPSLEALDLVRAAMLELWNLRLTDFRGAIEKHGQELADLERQIRRYADKVLDTDSKLLARTLEEKIEELSARKLRLGSRIEIDTANLATYDFETALRTVFDFLQEPHRMWQTGKLDVQRVVLRLVFREPLVYDLKTGFRTPTLSLPLEIAVTCGQDKQRMVELLGKSWNRLEVLVREWAEMLASVRRAA